MDIKKVPHIFFIVFILGIISCSKSNESSGFIDPNEELLLGLNKVNGYDHTYNYDFGILKEREKVDFYAPTSLSGGIAGIPVEMREKINLISPGELPFDVGNLKTNVVTSWNATNELIFQIQVSFLENTNAYDTNFKGFFIVSATQYPENPFADEDFTLELEENLPLSYQKLVLAENCPLYYKPDFGVWPRMFDYYSFVENENRVYKTSTGAYQYYAWYNGLIFRIGCNMDIEEVDPEPLVRKIILGD